jgi:hypothetical protein
MQILFIEKKRNFFYKKNQKERKPNEKLVKKEGEKNHANFIYRKKEEFFY